jgi:hypothetical protein
MVLVEICEAYIDDSDTHDGSAIKCAGGYLFKRKMAKAFNAHINPVFKKYGVEYIRMADLNRSHREGDNGPYAHLDDEQRDQLARAFITGVKAYSSYGFAATVNGPEYDATASRFSELPNAFGFLLMQCAFLVRRWVERNAYRGEIVYYVEDGTGGKGRAKEFFLNELMGTPEKRETYRYGGFAWVDKQKAPAVSTGDLLAWHWSKHHSRLKAGKSVRGDTLELIRPIDQVSDWASHNIEELRLVLEQRERGGLVALTPEADAIQPPQCRETGPSGQMRPST